MDGCWKEIAESRAGVGSGKRRAESGERVGLDVVRTQVVVAVVVTVVVVVVMMEWLGGGCMQPTSPHPVTPQRSATALIKRLAAHTRRQRRLDMAIPRYTTLITSIAVS